MTAATAFDPALTGSPAHLVRSDGATVPLDVLRWHERPTAQDRWLLNRCAAPVLDLGCGPGRLVAALVRRRVEVLGVDVSVAAAAQCRRRGNPMLRQDLFARLPAEGSWGTVLLADGNIGIGGDPLRLLRRAAALLRPGGRLLVECDPHPDLLWRGSVQVSSAGGVGEWIPWAGAAALGWLAAAAGLFPAAGHRGERCFLELVKPGR